MKMYVLRAMCLCLTVVVVLILSVAKNSDNSSDTSKNPMSSREVIQSCLIEAKFSDDALITLSKNGFMPQTKPEKCVMGCYLRKLNIINNGKLSENRLNTFANEKFGANQTAVNQAKSLFQVCANKAHTAGTDECTLAGVFITCFEEEAQKTGLQLQTVPISHSKLNLTIQVIS